jgi:zinc protease
VYGLSSNELRQYVTKLNAVTMTQINQVIQEWIQPDRLVIVTAGSEPSATQK